MTGVQTCALPIYNPFPINSVAIHLRKGDDYMQSELMGKGLCTVDYYMKAIDYMRKHINNPHFYVFTDNPCWVKDNLPATFLLQPQYFLIHQKAKK